MRRMITSKQVESVQKLAGLTADSVYNEIPSFPNPIVFDEISYIGIEEEDFDAEAHEATVYLYFTTNDLDEYSWHGEGLDEKPTISYYVVLENLPESITTVEELENWIKNNDLTEYVTDSSLEEWFISHCNPEGEDDGYIEPDGTTYDHNKKVLVTPSYHPFDNELIVNGSLTVNEKLDVKENAEFENDAGFNGPAEFRNTVEIKTGTAGSRIAKFYVDKNLPTADILGCIFRPQYNGAVHQLGFEKCSLIQVKTLLSIVGDPTSSKKLTNLPLSVAGFGPQVDEQGGTVDIYSPVITTLVNKYISLDAAEVAAINAWAPQTLRIALKDDLFEAYGIANTKIVIGSNTYVFDPSDEEAFVLQGTWSNLATGYGFVKIEIVDKTKSIYFYNA